MEVCERKAITDGSLRAQGKSRKQVEIFERKVKTDGKTGGAFRAQGRLGAIPAAGEREPWTVAVNIVGLSGAYNRKVIKLILVSNFR